MTTSAAGGARSLREFLAEVPDPRQKNRVPPLAAVLALTTCAMLCGARSLYAAAQWGRDHSGEVAQALGFRREKTPWVATLHNVFKGMEVAAFEAALAGWLAQAQPTTGAKRKAAAIDGKSLRGSQGHQLSGLHLLAAFGARLGLPILQVQTGRGPGGELAAARELLAKLDLAGVVITGDALFAQRELCAQITKRGGAYLLSVKANPPDWQQSILDFFAHPPPHGLKVKETSHTDAPADRVETRTLRASAGLSPQEASAGELLRLWRGHWGIETRLHYVRDVTLGEDACRVRTGHAPQALAAVRNAVISLACLAGGTNRAAALRRFAANPPKPWPPLASTTSQIKRPCRTQREYCQRQMFST